MLTVEVVNDPNISITSSEGTQIKVGEGTTLTVENVPPRSTYLWTSGDGEISEDEELIINPLENVTYTVEITTPEGCIFLAEISITVTILDIAIPNLFTPNGDELNDKFYIINDDLLYEITEFKVFDRWGELVHNIPNGTYKGRNMPSDIYIYLFTIKSMSGEETFFKGDVALMR
jgi:gliding motility-associated-like protein